jgi:hypothetical protein
VSPARGGALHRAASVARGTLADLFAGQAGALLLLALVGVAVAPAGVRATGERELNALLLRERMQLVAALSAAAAVLAAAHAVAAERRSLDFARALTTPLSAFEALAGRIAGVVAGVGALAVAAGLAVLLLPRAGLLHAREQFAPRDLVAPAAATLSAPEGARRLKPDESALLEAGGALELRFDVASPRGLELALVFAPDGGESEEPLEWSLSIGRSSGIQELLRARGGVEGLVTVALPEGTAAPVVVTVRALEGEQPLLLDAPACRLRGPPRSIAWSVARALAGLVALVTLSSALGGALAAALPDVLASAGAGCLLLLAALRSLFVDVSDLLADPHARVGAATRAVAEGIARLLSLLPDLARATAADEIARGRAPWSGADLAAIGLSLGLAAVAWLAGAAWLRRRAGATG